MEINAMVSTTIVGLLVLSVVLLIVRSMWRKKKAGGSCMCSCSGCSQACARKSVEDIKQSD